MTGAVWNLNVIEMRKNLLILIVMAWIAGASSAHAQIVVDVDLLGDAVVIDKKPIAHEQGSHSRFAWGLDVGSAIDMTGNDMSALDINACLGYSGPYVRFIGVGASIDMMVSNSTSTYPVYLMYQTDFSRTRRLCFMELRAGWSFCNIENYKTQQNTYGSLGVGVTLAKGRSFSSHIVLSYNYTRLDDVPRDDGTSVRIHDLQSMMLRIGILF